MNVEKGNDNRGLNMIDLYWLHNTTQCWIQ